MAAYIMKTNAMLRSDNHWASKSENSISGNMKEALRPLLCCWLPEVGLELKKLPGRA